MLGVAGIPTGRVGPRPQWPVGLGARRAWLRTGARHDGADAGPTGLAGLSRLEGCWSLTMIAYTVVAEFDDPQLLKQWLEWLKNGHLADVCAAGATDAEALALEGVSQGGRTVHRAEARYHFATREDFAAYERHHAPRLRAEGLRRFPTERGVRYRRTVGEVVATSRKQAS